MFRSLRKLLRDFTTPPFTSTCCSLCYICIIGRFPHVCHDVALVEDHNLKFLRHMIPQCRFESTHSEVFQIQLREDSPGQTWCLWQLIFKRAFFPPGLCTACETSSCVEWNTSTVYYVLISALKTNFQVTLDFVGKVYDHNSSSTSYICT